VSENDSSERLEFEKKKHEDEIRLAKARLGLDRSEARKLSTGAVTIIAAVVALASAAFTALIGGYWQVAVQQEASLGQLQLEKTRVEADLQRLRQDQQFQILLRATQNQTPEIAAQNLAFFVDIGYLDDVKGKIKEYADKGRAPTISAINSNPGAGFGSTNGAATLSSAASCKNVPATIYAWGKPSVSRASLNPEGGCTLSVNDATKETGTEVKCHSANATAYVPKEYDASVSEVGVGCDIVAECRVDCLK
jgi:hypothetical protein